MLSLSDYAVLICHVLCCAMLRCVVNYIGVRCSIILFLLHWSAGIAVLHVQGNYLHVFLSLLLCRLKGSKGNASSHCPNILVVLAPTGGGECTEG